MRKCLLLAMSLLLASCQQNYPSAWLQSPESAPTGTLLVHLILPGDPATKVLGTATEESAVNTLQIFVFKDLSSTDPTQNLLETDKWSSDGRTTLTLNTYVGKKKVWALVNAPRQSFENEYELMSHYSMLEENSATGLVMTGGTGIEVGEFNTAASVGAITPVSITVTHLGARISVRNINVDFSNTSLEGCFLDIKEVYVLNAVNSVSLGGTSRTTAELGSSACWYNLEAWNESVPAAARAILGDRGDMGISIGPTTGTQDLNRHFYVYPNVSTAANDNTEATASARLTRIILHGYVRGSAGRNAGDNAAHGEESYYCFDIPKSSAGATLERNHTYDIENITITMPGGASDAPGDRPKFGKLSATVTVGQWGGHTTLTYEL
ncbi:MAG: hypothetical protein J5646_02655 [Bacteroidales bacterium]|nr:hypothetical protein [Bacteroidales bacterium]